MLISGSTFIRLLAAAVVVFAVVFGENSSGAYKNEVEDAGLQSLDDSFTNDHHPSLGHRSKRFTDMSEVREARDELTKLLRRAKETLTDKFGKPKSEWSKIEHKEYNKITKAAKKEHGFTKGWRKKFKHQLKHELRQAEKELKREQRELEIEELDEKREKKKKKQTKRKKDKNRRRMEKLMEDSDDD